ncbi:MAG: deoxynucleoside kinase [Clostridia bacterium]|nr:deoxynucleoside kinase [Clostridia bacterium]
MDLKGKIIVIEGTDGSGKQTQAKLLTQRLEELGAKVYSKSFPNYDSESSSLVKMYLNGEISSSVSDVSAKAASVFYAADRYVTYKKEIEPLYKTGEHTFVFDRYVESNIIHQGAKMLTQDGDEKTNNANLSDFVEWVSSLEYNDMAIPRPDLTIYLYVPIEYTIKMRENRANKSNGEAKQDIHESNVDYLKSACKTGLLAAKKYNWQVINCVENDILRSIEDISEEIFTIIKNNL